MNIDQTVTCQKHQKNSHCEKKIAYEIPTEKII